MSQALEGIKVLDLSRILAGPWASQMLADLGAKVIKVERPKYGDDTRIWGPPFISNPDNEIDYDAAYFHCANRNKSSVAIDITQPQGQEIIKSLIKKCDVLIENFKVGGLKKYGLDYNALKSINPQLVYCSITGFGQTGPCSNRAGYDAMIQGEGGLMSLTGEPNGMPIKVGVAVVDIMTGLYSCNAILAALMARHHTNKGQYIDIALLDVQLATLANQGMNYLATNENPKRHGNGHPNIVPYQTFTTQDGAIILAVGNDEQFKRLCQLIGNPKLAQDPKYKRNEARVENRKTLISILENIFTSQKSDDWLTALENISVPCGAVNTVEQVVNHPQILHREMIKDVVLADGHSIKTIANPINFSDTPIKYLHAAPSLGQHTESVLSEVLNLPSETIEELKKAKVIA